MKHFIEVPLSEGKCDLCGEEIVEGERGFVLVNHDSMDIFCSKCGEYAFALLNTMLSHFNLAYMQKREEEKKEYERRKRIQNQK